MNFWDARYKEPGAAYGTDPNDFLRTSAQALRRGRVLSLCEGEGRNAVFLAQLGHDVVAVDGSAVGLQNAEKLAARRGVRIHTILADMADFAIQPNSWDGIILIFAHLPPAIRHRIHQSAAAGLRQGGALLFEAYHNRQLQYGTGGPKNPELLVTLKETMDEFFPLEFLIAREVDRDIHEGAFHQGWGSVVQIVARWGYEISGPHQGG